MVDLRAEVVVLDRAEDDVQISSEAVSSSKVLTFIEGVDQSKIFRQFIDADLSLLQLLVVADSLIYDHLCQLH